MRERFLAFSRLPVLWIIIVKALIQFMYLKIHVVWITKHRKPVLFGDCPFVIVNFTTFVSGQISWPY